MKLSAIVCCAGVLIGASWVTVFMLSREAAVPAAATALIEVDRVKEAGDAPSPAIVAGGVKESAADAWRRLESTMRINDFDVRFEARKSLLAQLARLDGRRAAAYLAALNEAERLPELVALVVNEWATVEAEGALAWFASQGGEAQSQLTTAMGRGLSAHALERVQTLLLSLSDGAVRVCVADAIVRAWTFSRPEEAARLAVATMSGQACIDALGGVVSEWVRTDAARVAHWMSQLPEGSVRSGALSHLATLWGGADAPAAARFAQTLPTGEHVYRAVLAGLWAQSDPRAATEWMLTLSTETQQRALGSLVAGWARSAPQDAGDFVIRFAAGQARDTALLSVASAWAASDPMRAAQWVAEFPSGALRLQAINCVADRWIHVDPSSTIAWQQTLATGAERDAALQASASRLVRQYPDLAMEIATVISDPLIREEQTSRAAMAWLSSDPLAASRWIAQSSLPRALKQRLLPH